MYYDLFSATPKADLGRIQPYFAVSRPYHHDSLLILCGLAVYIDINSDDMSRIELKVPTYNVCTIYEPVLSSAGK